MRKCFNGTLNIIKYVLQNDNECFHDSWLLQWNAMYKQTVTPNRERECEEKKKADSQPTNYFHFVYQTFMTFYMGC